MIEITLPGRPLSLNEVKNDFQRRDEIKLWRTRAKLIGKKWKGAFSSVALVDIEVTMNMRGRRFDHISPAFAIKGATDGLVEAGVIPNDSPVYVRRIILNSPVTATREVLVFKITEVGE